MAKAEPLDDVVADPLVLGVVRGDRTAWFQLTLYIEQWVLTHVPSHWRMRKARLTQSEDDVRDVMLEVLERVGKDDFRALRQYLDRKLADVPDVRSSAEDEPQLTTFAAWLRGLVDFSIRDHVRKRYGRPSERAEEGKEENDAPTITKRDLQSWAVHPTQPHSGQFGGAQPGVTRVLTARSILRYAAEVFDERELKLFRRYLEQASFEELSAEFELPDKSAAEAEVRKLKERLRVRFRSETSGDS
jgi:DNA-directed RNA polymerase specialized sigma24 family protein